IHPKTNASLAVISQNLHFFHADDFRGGSTGMAATVYWQVQLNAVLCSLFYSGLNIRRCVCIVHNQLALYGRDRCVNHAAHAVAGGFVSIKPAKVYVGDSNPSIVHTLRELNGYPPALGVLCDLFPPVRLDPVPDSVAACLRHADKVCDLLVRQFAAYSADTLDDDFSSFFHGFVLLTYSWHSRPYCSDHYTSFQPQKPLQRPA